MLIVIVAMAVGVIFGRHSIKGSCGGSDKGNCICVDKCDKRKKLEAQYADAKVLSLELLEKSPRN